TMALVKEVNYASAFSFKYSRRPGTPGATMGKQVAEEEKSERLARLQTLLEDQKQAFNKSLVGQTLPILIEKKGRQPGQLGGRSPYLQGVHATGPESLIGQIVPVHIEGVMTNSLSGKLV
ncbi:MAG: TRAM domain-containing protein, partial [Pseudomonadota bacterium]